MMDDVLVKSGYTSPENWKPVENSKEAVELLNAIAAGLDSWKKRLIKNAQRMEQMMARDE